MDQSIDIVNNMERSALQTLLARCCGATRWLARMLDQRPFTDWSHLRQAADDTWWELEPADWREAFDLHPKIGDLDNSEAKFADTQAWSEREQAGIQEAADAGLQGLAQGNRDYERKSAISFWSAPPGKALRRCWNCCVNACSMTRRTSCALRLKKSTRSCRFVSRPGAKS